MKAIQLTQGKVAIVDDDDFEKVNKFKWYALLSRGRFYAARNILVSNGKLIHLGYSEKAENADDAYRKAEKKYFGKFARHL